jgi:hypothetical protein
MNVFEWLVALVQNLAQKMKAKTFVTFGLAFIRLFAPFLWIMIVEFAHLSL